MHYRNSTQDEEGVTPSTNITESYLPWQICRRISNMAASFWDSCCWRKHCASLLNCLSNTHLNRTVCSVILPSLWQKFGFGEFEAILFATILKLPGRRGIFGIYFTFRKFCRKLNNNFLGKTQKSWDFVAISLCCVLQARLVLNTVYSEPYLQKTTTFVWRPAKHPPWQNSRRRHRHGCGNQDEPWGRQEASWQSPEWPSHSVIRE